MSHNENNRMVLDALTATIRERATDARPLMIGLTGSVAVGKSTLCRQISALLSPALSVETLPTDGFLLPNAQLNALGLAKRKGYPETYDADALFAALQGLRTGPTDIPGYSHVTYDVDPALTRRVEAPDVVILEGLAFSPFADGRTIADEVDLLIYIDASEPDLEDWFAARFLTYWRAAEHDSASFYAQFRHMSEAEADAFGRMIWERINLPNLRDHIVLSRERADIVVRKSSGHRLELMRTP